jgi:16S rRNA (guanine527-N7)-methyltransferase
MMERLARTAYELLSLRLSASQLQAFRRYADELIDWNQRVNLTAITDPADIEVRHFVDSLSCLRVMKPRAPGLRVIDVGTGAGFPGLPVKIACPNVDLTLVEATGKKVAFLHHVVEALGLEGVTLVNERVEALGQMTEHRERYDWALARAVAGMRTLAEYLLPLCRVGGHCLAQKGESAHQEVAGAQRALELLGGHLVQVTPVELPTVAETRYLVDIEKVAATPPRYPRRVGVPSKRPL